MGCAASRIDKEERVRVSKERKYLMKQLVGFRGGFADAQLAYLRALRNTGATLRQFTESETLELDTNPYGLVLPASPPPPLPPSPPPPPPFSPDLRKLENNQKEEVGLEDSIDVTEDDSSTPPPPPVPSSSWESWDLFGSSSPQHQKESEAVEPPEEETWAETKMEFEEDEHEEETVANVVNSPPKKLQLTDSVKDNSSTMKLYTKDSADMEMVLWRSKKTLEGIAKVLDDYFLKSSDGLKEIAVLMDIKRGDTFLPLGTNESKRKRCNSAKVFSALSWTRSSRSLFSRDMVESSGPSEPCRPGAHCITLQKLYDAEKKLYKDIKEEEYAKLERDRRSKSLLKQEDEDNDWTKTEKTRLSVESLESDILLLQHSINTTCSSLVRLIDDELYPQLVTLTSGLLHMWRKMHECHQVQNYISQQLKNLTDIQKLDFGTTSHRQAAIQLETEVSCWYNSFCEVVKSQQQYVKSLCRWIQLTDNLVDENRPSVYAASVRQICEQWNLAFEGLQDKEAAEAIKSFLSAIHSILLQQEEEQNQQKKTEKLEKKLQKELYSLAEMEKKMEGSFTAEDECSSLGPKHPLSLKRGKIDALKKQVETEKAKYLNLVQATKAMTLEHLKTSLPKVFHALLTFSRLYVEAMEAVCGQIEPVDGSDGASPSS